MRKWICVVLTLILVLGLFAGCTKPSGPSDGTQPVDKTISDEKLTYTIFAYGLQQYDGQNADRVISVLEEKFNVTLKFTGAPWDGWQEKLSSLINSGQTPDLFFALPNQASYANYVKNEMMLPLDAYVTAEETPYLSALLGSDNFKNLTFDGKHYFMPVVCPQNNHMIVVRRDWMEKLNIEAPKTLEEFTAMLQKFTENDPDGNGKKDTYGMTASSTLDWFVHFKTSYGVTPGWSKNSEGKYQLDVFSDGYADYLSYLQNLYAKGYLKQEFYLGMDSDADEDFAAGRAGCYLTNNGMKIEQITDTLGAADPSASIDVIPVPSATAQGSFVGFGGYWGGWNISADAKEPMRLIQMLDYISSPEGQMLMTYGIEGVHYTVQDGNFVPNIAERQEEGDDKWQNPSGEPIGPYCIGQYFTNNIYTIENGQVKIRFDYGFFSNPEIVEKANQYSENITVNLEPVNILDFPSDYNKIMARMNDKIEILSVRIISGQLTVEEGLAELQAELKTLGYEKMVGYVTETMSKFE